MLAVNHRCGWGRGRGQGPGCGRDVLAGNHRCVRKKGTPPTTQKTLSQEAQVGPEVHSQQAPRAAAAGPEVALRPSTRTHSRSVMCVTHVAGPGTGPGTQEETDSPVSWEEALLICPRCIGISPRVVGLPSLGPLGPSHGSWTWGRSRPGTGGAACGVRSHRQRGGNT